MKLICINNMVKKGFLFPIDEKQPLTIDKVYEAFAFPIVFSVFEGTKITLDDVRFLVYNDKKEWQVYDKELFQPQE